MGRRIRPASAKSWCVTPNSTTTSYSEPPGGIREMLTYDQSPYRSDDRGNHRGVSLGGQYRTHDGRTCDSTGAFLVGELERLDQMMHLPLASVTWSRDIDLRQDVTIADEVSSFTTTTFGSPGGT